MSKLRVEKYDVVFLQETHLLQKEAEKSLGGWMGKVFYNVGTSNNSEQLQFKSIKQIKDK